MVLRRTTVVLEDSVYRQVKQAALDLDMTIRELVQEALRRFCEGRRGVRQTPRRPHFGAFQFRVKETLRRTDLYEDRV